MTNVSRQPGRATAFALLLSLLLVGCGERADTTDTRAAPGEVPTASVAKADPVGADRQLADDVPLAASMAPPSAPDVPLAAGWPVLDTEEGPAEIEVPVRALDNDVAELMCGRPGPRPDATERVRGQVVGLGVGVSRELLVFDDADAAVRHLGRLRDFYASCPTARDGGLAYPVRIHETGSSQMRV